MLLNNDIKRVVSQAYIPAHRNFSRQIYVSQFPPPDNRHRSSVGILL